jgi:large subunit ribosomal protein L18
MPREKNPRDLRLARHKRVRKKVHGTPERPRLCVFRSLKGIYAQVVNDAEGHTVAAASSLEPEIKASGSGLSKTEVSKLVGKTIAQRTKSTGASTVVFDRGGYLYHGRVKALADAAREEGLVF